MSEDFCYTLDGGHQVCVEYVEYVRACTAGCGRSTVMQVPTTESLATGCVVYRSCGAASGGTSFRPSEARNAVVYQPHPMPVGFGGLRQTLALGVCVRV